MRTIQNRTQTICVRFTYGWRMKNSRRSPPNRSTVSTKRSLIGTQVRSSYSEMFRLGERSPFLCGAPLQISRRAYTKAQRKRFRQAWTPGCLDVPTVLASRRPRRFLSLIPRLAELLSHSGEARHPYTTDHGAGFRPQGHCLQKPLSEPAQVRPLSSRIHTHKAERTDTSCDR